MSKYIDKIKEHFPGASINSAYGMCPGGFFKYGMREDTPGCTGDCALCWNAEAPEDEVYCDRDEYDIPEDWRAAPASEAKNIINAQAAATAETFNYAVLSAEMGDYLRRKEEQLKNEYMNFTANCGRIFAEAQEKLAKHGFGENNGIFEKWITAMGFTKPTVYRMISIYNFRSSQIETNEGQAVFDALPKTLQADISAPSAPPQLVEQVMSGDITTHKEYIALKKQLEAAEEHNAALSAEKEQFHRASKANLEKLNEERDRNAALERQLKELESRPRDVAVDTEELNRRLTEASAKLQKQAAEQVAEERRDFADKLNRMEEERDRLENRIAELESSENSTEQKDKEIAELKEQIEHLSNKKIKVFAVKLTVEEFERLMDIAKKSGDPIISNAVSTAQIIRI